MVGANCSEPVGGGTLILVGGPSRGGKSRWAESLLIDEPKVTYIATSASRPDDPSWQERLRLHRKRRPAHWQLLEVGADLAQAIREHADGHALLIDALGGYVAQHLDRDQMCWQKECERLIAVLSQSPCTCVLVVEETGWGVVPPTRIGGLFRDRLGDLAQQLDRIASRSWLVIQGRALDLHQLSHPVP